MSYLHYQISDDVFIKKLRGFSNMRDEGKPQSAHDFLGKFLRGGGILFDENEKEFDRNIRKLEPSIKITEARDDTVVLSFNSYSKYINDDLKLKSQFIEGMDNLCCARSVYLIGEETYKILTKDIDEEFFNRDGVYIAPTTLRLHENEDQPTSRYLAFLQDAIEAACDSMTELNMAGLQNSPKQKGYMKEIEEAKEIFTPLFAKFAQEAKIMPIKKSPSYKSSVNSLSNYVSFIKMNKKAMLTIEMTKLATNDSDTYYKINQGMRSKKFNRAFTCEAPELIQNRLTENARIGVHKYYQIDKRFSFAEPRLFALTNELKNFDKQIKPNSKFALSVHGIEAVGQARRLYEDMGLIPIDENKDVIKDIEVIRFASAFHFIKMENALVFGIDQIILSEKDEAVINLTNVSAQQKEFLENTKAYSEKALEVQNVKILCRNYKFKPALD